MRCERPEPGHLLPYSDRNICDFPHSISDLSDKSIPNFRQHSVPTLGNRTTQHYVLPPGIERTRQWRLVLWVERVWRGSIEDRGVNRQEKIRYEFICFLPFPSLSLKRLKPRSRTMTQITHNTFRHYRVQFSRNSCRR